MRDIPTIKIALVGEDSNVNDLLRSYVDQLSNKPLEWINAFRFFIIPTGKEKDKEKTKK